MDKKDKLDYPRLEGLLFGMSRPDRSLTKGFTLAELFEISDIIIEKDVIKLHTASWCMFPVLMKEDILKIIPAKAKQMSIGDIAVFRRFKKIYSHRVVDKKIINGETFIFTRPDAAKSGDDGPTGDGNLLGKVVSILRKGKIYSPEKRDFSIIERISYFFIFFKIQIKERFQFGLRLLLELFRRYRICRRFLFKLFSGVRSQMRFSLGLPTNPKLTARFFNYIRVEKIDFNILERLKETRCWHIVVCYKDSLVGYITLASRLGNYPYNEYYIEDLFVRHRYRGAKIGTDMYRQFERILSEIDVTKIYVSVDNNNVTRRFFESLGFVQTQMRKGRTKGLEKVLR